MPAASQERRARPRDLGIVIGAGTPGLENAITDVVGVRVGHTTLVDGDGELVVGRGPVRTGVTVIVPHSNVGQATIFAGCHRLNGNGELTGLEWVRESGLLTSPVAITNTHSVGVVRDALIAAEVRDRPSGETRWSLPVVGETWDGYLNDINGMHVEAEHVWSALDTAAEGAVDEGNVGGGTGMICHEFKGGIGTSSRLVDFETGSYTVGVLVQANYGQRERLNVGGVPVGRLLPKSVVPGPEMGGQAARTGSIIVVVGTDAPLLPHQCSRIAQRAGLGIARVGGVAAHTSGDLFLSFATGMQTSRLSCPTMTDRLPEPSHSFSESYISPLYEAVVDATEEAIVNALVAADTMVGRDGNTAHAVPIDRLRELVAAYEKVLTGPAF